MIWNRLLILLFPALMSQSGFGACTPNKVIVFISSPSVDSADFQAGNKFESSAGFSKAIISEARRNACAVHIINDLSPINDIDSNGLSVLNELLRFQSANPSLQETPIELIGQGLGGLYALKAIDENAKHKLQLPLVKLSLISTPMNGLELADLLAQNQLVGSQLKALFSAAYPGFSLEIFLQVSKEKVHNFLATLILPENFILHSYAGVQYESELPTIKSNAAKLSPTLAALNFLIDQKSDGIVSLQSALFKPSIKSSSGSSFANHFIHGNFNIGLDHLEQTSEPVYFKSLGFSNIEFISQKQKRMIRYILNQ